MVQIGKYTVGYGLDANNEDGIDYGRMTVEQWEGNSRTTLLDVPYDDGFEILDLMASFYGLRPFLSQASDEELFEELRRRKFSGELNYCKTVKI
jgi:hypothetical protein